MPAGVLLAAALLASPAPAAAPAEAAVLEAIQDGRKQAGVARLERRPTLDAAARSRAELVARTPHERRLSIGQAIDVELREAGAEPYRRVVPYLVLKRGYADYPHAFIAGLQEDPAHWTEVLSGRLDAIGLSVINAADGWVVLVAVLVEDAVVLPPPDRAQLERDTIAAVNAARLEHGGQALIEDPQLSEIARAHSADMARRGFMDHVTPEGLDAAARVERRGLSFSRLGENLHTSKGMTDLVRTAVDGWLDSPGHRATMLAQDYTHTGLGVAIDAQGVVYFTQLFLRPAE